MSESQDYVDGTCPASPGGGRRLSHSGTSKEFFRGGVLLLTVLMLAGLTAVPPAAQAQQQDTLGRAAQQRAEQLRQRREAEMRQRMRKREREIQARIRRNAAPPAPGGVVEEDSLALVALYNSTNGDNWRNNDGWLEAPVADWRDVTVSGDRVMRVSLRFNQLTGEIPPKISELSNLQRLDLGSNQLTGEVPPELSELSNLEELDLSFNQLTGGIPPGLSELSNLEFLTLSSNQLTGEVPSKLSELSNLEDLYLGKNQLTGEIPTELSELSSLKILRLGNKLTGGIPPELSELSNLEELILSSNQLTGDIPPELSELSNLEELDLRFNQLTGEIPPGLSELSNLRSLGLPANQLTGEIPPELSELSNLGRLDLSDNQLTGGIPLELSELSNLRLLRLSDNQLTGEIPPGLSELSNLELLDLSDSELTGEIPPGLSELSNLQSLTLGSNQLTGEIPSKLSELSNLELLDLSDSELTGEIPSGLSELSDLEYLWLSSNELTGEVPPELSELSNLEDLSLSRNQLTGAIPVSFANLTAMSNSEFGRFWFDNTILCEPPDEEFQAWITEIENVWSTGVTCEASGPPANVRLTSVNARPQDASSFSSYAPSEVTGVRSGVDLRFEGIVTGADGNPFSNVQVDVYNSLRYAPGEGDDGVRSVTTSSDGTFQYPSADEDPLSTAPLAAGVRPFWFNPSGTDVAIPFALYLEDTEGDVVEQVNETLATAVDTMENLKSMRAETGDSGPFADLAIEGRSYPPDDAQLGSSANDDFFLYYYTTYAGPTDRAFLLADDHSTGWLKRGYDLSQERVARALEDFPERFEDTVPPPLANSSTSSRKEVLRAQASSIDAETATNASSVGGKLGYCALGPASGGLTCLPIAGEAAKSAFRGIVSNSELIKSAYCPGIESGLYTLEGCIEIATFAITVVETVAGGVGSGASKGLSTLQRALASAERINSIVETAGSVTESVDLLRSAEGSVKGFRIDLPGSASLNLTNPIRPNFDFDQVQFENASTPSTLGISVTSGRATYETGTANQTAPSLQIGGASFSMNRVEGGTKNQGRTASAEADSDNSYLYRAEIPVSELPGYDGDPGSWNETIRVTGTSFETLQGNGTGAFSGIEEETFNLISPRSSKATSNVRTATRKRSSSAALASTKLTVPANAFGGSTSFVDFTHTSYGQVARSDQPSLRPRSPVVQVNTNRDFANPATITLGLKDGNGSSEELNVYWRGESSSWQQVPATIDLSDGTATAEITQPGYYAVLVSKTPARVVRRTEVASGWNMVGMPAEPESAGLGPFLPSSCGPGFRWRPGQGSYQTFGSEETLPAGGGAWTFCESSGTAELKGDPVRPQEKTVEVSPGWNQVGPFEEAIAPGAVGQEPSGLLQEGTWFRWDPDQGSYAEPSELTPGAGYWVFATESGTLNFSGGGAKAGGDRPERLAREAPEGALTLAVSDQAGHRAELHLVSELTEAARARWRLPPKGPGSVFDVRFGNGLRVAAAAGDSAEAEAGRGALMQLQGTEGTVTLRLETGRAELQGRSVRAIDLTTGGERLETRLTAQSPTATVPAGTERLRVSAGRPPVEAALRKPYPNPAGQQATLEYALPEARETTIVAYDVLGRKVATLIEGEREAGRHRLQVETRRFASGVYFVRMRAEGFQQTRRITILK
jgi:Leucine-rich repeat (LRR) protein